MRLRVALDQIGQLFDDGVDIGWGAVPVLGSSQGAQPADDVACPDRLFGDLLQRHLHFINFRIRNAQQPIARVSIGCDGGGGD